MSTQTVVETVESTFTPANVDEISKLLGELRHKQQATPEQIADALQSWCVWAAKVQYELDTDQSAQALRAEYFVFNPESYVVLFDAEDSPVAIYSAYSLQPNVRGCDGAAPTPNIQA